MAPPMGTVRCGAEALMPRGPGTSHPTPQRGWEPGSRSLARPSLSPAAGSHTAPEGTLLRWARMGARGFLPQGLRVSRPHEPAVVGEAQGGLLSPSVPP